MRKKLINSILLLSILLTGCSSNEDEFIETQKETIYYEEGPFVDTFIEDEPTNTEIETSIYDTTTSIAETNTETFTSLDMVSETSVAETILPEEPMVDENFQSNLIEDSYMIYPDLIGHRPDYIISNDKTVYLTFDDGPNAKTTPLILDLLKENNIKATFFIVGTNIEGNEEILNRIINEGHLLGIHTFSHDYNQIYSSVDAYLNDFKKCYDTIVEATNYTPWAFRFPGGSINNYNTDLWQDIANEMNERGFEFFDWTASIEDATTNANYESCMKQFYNSCTNKYEIVLMHDSKNISLECLPEIIEYCKNNNYSFDTLSNANYHFKN